MRVFLVCIAAAALSLRFLMGQVTNPDPGAEAGSTDVAPNPELEEKLPEDDVEPLVADLADESYQVREAAQLKLWSLGESAVNALQQGMKSKDPERAYRSRVLLRRIVTGVGPGTRPEIVELVEQYFRGGIERKRMALERLRDERAYSQVLRLFRFETDPEVREECEEVVEEVVRPAVQTELVRGDLSAAEALLRLAPPTEENLRRRAALSRELGNLDADLADTEEGQNDSWRLALLRAKGDVTEAIALAKKLGRADIVACLSLFQGDPEPYFNWYIDQPQRVTIFQLNAELARNRWIGDERGALQIKKIMEDRVEEGAEEEKSAMLSLLLNGYLEEAMKAWEKDGEYREFAYLYYESVELPDKAIAVYGYEGSEEQRKKWRSEQLEGLRGGWDEADEQLTALLTVAAFLTNRGEREDGYGLAREVAEVVKKQGGEEELREYLDWLWRKGGAHYELSFAVAADQLDEDSGDDEVVRILGSLFRETESALRHWQRLKEEKDLNVGERLMFLGGIYGYLDWPAEQLEGYLARVFAEAAALNGQERKVVLGDLLAPAATRDDAKSVLELLEGLVEFDGFAPWSRSVGLYASFLGNWERSTEAWETMMGESTFNYRTLAKLGSTNLRLGRKEESIDYFDKVELLALDEAEVLAALAEETYAMGIRDKSEEYLRQILMTGSPRSQTWIGATEQYATFAKLAKNWRVAAACSEVHCLYGISDRSTSSSPTYYLRDRFGADLLRALALHAEGDEAGARALLERCFMLLEGDGLLADDFFPLLREVGLTEDHDRFFELAFRRIQESIRAFPKAHNTYNSGAWLASRAARRLDEGHAMAESALGLLPKQAAYLDTMAEVWFALRDREKAVEWSLKACRDSYNAGHSQPGGAELREQLRRFQEDEFPVR